MAKSNCCNQEVDPDNIYFELPVDTSVHTVKGNPVGSAGSLSEVCLYSEVGLERTRDWHNKNVETEFGNQSYSCVQSSRVGEGWVGNKVVLSDVLRNNLIEFARALGVDGSCFPESLCSELEGEGSSCLSVQVGSGLQRHERVDGERNASNRSSETGEVLPGNEVSFYLIVGSEVGGCLNLNSSFITTENSEFEDINVGNDEPFSLDIQLEFNTNVHLSEATSANDLKAERAAAELFSKAEDSDWLDGIMVDSECLLNGPAGSFGCMIVDGFGIKFEFDGTRSKELVELKASGLKEDDVVLCPFDVLNGSVENVHDAVVVDTSPIKSTDDNGSFPPKLGLFLVRKCDGEAIGCALHVHNGGHFFQNVQVGFYGNVVKNFRDSSVLICDGFSLEISLQRFGISGFYISFLLANVET